MELYFVLICSILTFNNIYATNFIEPTDESILDKIIRADQEEGVEQIINQGQLDLPPNKIPNRRQNVPEDERQGDRKSPGVESGSSNTDEDFGDDQVSPPPPLMSQGPPKKISDEHAHFPPEEDKMEPTHDDENSETDEEVKKPTQEKPEPNCELPSETGPCRASKPRYFFNIKSNKCEQFIYGGCKGNGNNYLTIEDCENQCAPQKQRNKSSSFT